MLSITKPEIVSEAQRLGLELIGFGDGLVVLAKGIPSAVTGLLDLKAKQAGCNRIIEALEAAAKQLAEWLRERGADAEPLRSHAQSPTDNTPAGQGSARLRQAAVACGLGSWGLNMAVLTPRFGPRVYFAGIRADLGLEADPPLDHELCLGLEECGRCAAVCPETAIPMRAPESMSLAIVRGIEAKACLRSSYRNGAYGGCIECLQVCPVGQDYDEVHRSPLRQRDLPGGVRRIRAAGFVAVEHIGPQVRWPD